MSTAATKTILQVEEDAKQLVQELSRFKNLNASIGDVLQALNIATSSLEKSKGAVDQASHQWLLGLSDAQKTLMDARTGLSAQLSNVEKCTVRLIETIKNTSLEDGLKSLVAARDALAGVAKGIQKSLLTVEDIGEKVDSSCTLMRSVTQNIRLSQASANADILKRLEALSENLARQEGTSNALASMAVSLGKEVKLIREDVLWRTSTALVLWASVALVLAALGFGSFIWLIFAK